MPASAVEGQVTYGSRVRPRVSVTLPAAHLLTSVLLAAEIFGGGGCRRDRTKALEERALAASRAVSLARSRRALNPPRPRAQVLVRAQSIEVDDTAFFAALAPAERKHLLAHLPPGHAPEVPFFRPAFLSAGRTTPLAPDALAPEPAESAPLPDLLRGEVEIEGQAGSGDTRGPAVNVRFQRDTPFEVVLGVLMAAEHADLEPLPIVEGPRREGVLQFVPEGMGELGCPAPQIQVGPLGIMVSIEPSAGFVLSVPAGGKIQGPRWQRVVAHDGTCPSIPRQGGSLDLPAVTSLLREIAAQLPLCEEEVTGNDPRTGRLALKRMSRVPTEIVLIDADPRTPWQEIVASADAAAEAGFPRPRLRALEPPGGCREAIPPGALRERFSTP